MEAREGNAGSVVLEWQRELPRSKQGMIDVGSTLMMWRCPELGGGGGLWPVPAQLDKVSRHIGNLRLW